jgi:hypothetical protein
MKHIIFFFLMALPLFSLAQKGAKKPVAAKEEPAIKAEKTEYSKAVEKLKKQKRDTSYLEKEGELVRPVTIVYGEAVKEADLQGAIYTEAYNTSMAIAGMGRQWIKNFEERGKFNQILEKAKIAKVDYFKKVADSYAYAFEGPWFIPGETADKNLTFIAKDSLVQVEAVYTDSTYEVKKDTKNKLDFKIFNAEMFALTTKAGQQMLMVKGETIETAAGKAQIWVDMMTGFIIIQRREKLKK